MLIAVDLDLGAAVLAEQHLLANFDFESAGVAVVQRLAVTDGNNLALDRLLFGGIGDDDAALGLLVGCDTLDQDAVLEGTKIRL